MEAIMPLIQYGHLEYGENKVQEAITKWTEIKLAKPKIKLHLIGKLQTNKVKFALKYLTISTQWIQKTCKKIADEELKQNKRLRFFAGKYWKESKKSGINKDNLQ